MTKAHIVRWAALAVLATSLAGCSRPVGYPQGWPPPSPDLVGCPDLSGEYDGVDANLPALLAPERNFGKRFYHEHSVLIERDARDGHYTLTLRRTARGLVGFRDWHLKYNQDSAGDGGFVRIELEKGEDYDCSRGWFVGTKWAIMEQPLGDPQHVRLALAKDSAGNLIASVTTRPDTTVASPGGHDHTGHDHAGHDHAEWLHWPVRPAGSDAALRAVGRVSLVRYASRNGGGRVVATRFANYTADTICVDAPGLEHWEVRPPARVPPGGTPRTAAKPAPSLHCANGEQKLDQGDVARIAMRAGKATRVTWYPLGRAREEGATIEVPAPEELPSPGSGE